MSWPKEYGRSHRRTPGRVPEGQGWSSSSSWQVERASSGLCEDTCSPMGSTCQTSHAHLHTVTLGTCLGFESRPPPRPGLVTEAKTCLHLGSLSNQCSWSLQSWSLQDSFTEHRGTRLPCILGSSKYLMLNHHQEMLVLGEEGFGGLNPISLDPSLQHLWGLQSETS